MDARRLDEIAAAATAASVEAEVAGWRCKASPDLPFRRCNVAQPDREAALDRRAFDAALPAVRRWYHDRGSRLIVQVSEAMDGHEDLDRWLADAGLRHEAPVHVLTAGHEPVCDHCEALAMERVPVTAGIDERWAEAHGTVQGATTTDEARAMAYGRLLDRLGDRALGASCEVDGRVVGVAFGVLDDGWLGIFGMTTSSLHRRQGIATDVLWSLRAAASLRGTDQAYLQVETDNHAAIALYEGLGFTRSHGYHYRSEPTAPDDPA